MSVEHQFERYCRIGDFAITVHKIMDMYIRGKINKDLAMARIESAYNQLKVNDDALTDQSKNNPS